MGVFFSFPLAQGKPSSNRNRGVCAEKAWMELVSGLVSTSKGKEKSSVDVLQLIKNCCHLKPEEQIWGRKKKFKALVCKRCGLLLQIEEL